MKSSFCTCFTLILACCVSWSVSTSSTDNGFDAWSKLEISPLAFQHMDYNYKQIDIYAHAKNEELKEVSRKKYYFIPSCDLNAASASSKWNNITRQFEVKFQVYMWDQKLKQTVWEFLKTYEPGLKIHQIQVLPIDKVAVRCQDCRDFTVQETPQRYSSLPHKVDFKFLCITRERCDEVASRMKSNPQDFSGLNLIFALQNQRSQTKQISVSSNVAFNGELHTKLRNEFPNKDSIYLTSDDAKKLVSQSTQEIQAEYVSDSDIFDKDFADQVKSYVERLLVAGQNDTAKFRAENWESVFWEQDTARPDVLTSELNEVHSDLDEKAKNFLEQVYNETTKAENLEKIRDNLENEKSGSSESSSSDSRMNKKDVSVSASGSGLGISASVEAKYGEESASKSDLASKSASGSKDKKDLATESGKKKDNSVSKALKSDNVMEFLKKTKNIVSWNGRKFTPKPMSLTRVNIGSQDSATRIKNRQINLKYYSAALITAVSIPDEELPGDVVIVYQEITDIKKNLSQILAAQKALTEKNQQLKNSIENVPNAVNPEIDKVNKSLSKFGEVQKACWKKDQQWINTVELMRANITRELSTIVEKEKGRSVALASVLTPILDKILELMRDIRNGSYIEKIPSTTKTERKGPSITPECKLIPTVSRPNMPQYYICEKGMSWNMAEQYCTLHGMHLATVDHEYIYSQLTGFLKTYSQEKVWGHASFWIGATDSDDEGEWKWVSNGRPMTWTKWLDRMPHRNQPYDCLTLWKSQYSAEFFFNDGTCSTDTFFICEGAQM